MGLVSTSGKCSNNGTNYIIVIQIKYLHKTLGKIFENSLVNCYNYNFNGSSYGFVGKKEKAITYAYLNSSLICVTLYIFENVYSYLSMNINSQQAG